MRFGGSQCSRQREISVAINQNYIRVLFQQYSFDPDQHTARHVAMTAAVNAQLSTRHGHCQIGKKTTDMLASKCWPVCTTTSSMPGLQEKAAVTKLALMNCGLAPETVTIFIIAFLSLLNKRWPKHKLVKHAGIRTGTRSHAVKGVSQLTNHRIDFLSNR